MTISPDGAWLAFGTQQGNTCIWHSSPEGFRPAPCEVGKDSDPVTTIRFSPGSRWLATTCTSACAAMNAPVALWDLNKDVAKQGPERLLHATELSEDSLLAISFGDDTRLAVAYGYRAEVWDLTRSDPPAHVVAKDARGQWINAVALSPDDRWLATGSLEAEIHLTELTHPERPPIVLKGHNAGVRALSFSDDGRWLASGSDDATARLWNMTDPAFPSTLLRGQDNPVGRVLFAPGAEPSHLLTVGTIATDEPDARLWGIPDPLIDPVVLHGSPAPLAGMAVSPDGKWIAMSNEGDAGLALWSTTDPRKPVAHLPIPGQSHSISFSGDGRWMAAKSETFGVVSLWELRNLSKPPIELAENTDSDNESLSFSPDSRWLVSGTWGGEVNMWDVSNDDPVTTPRHQCQQGAGVRLRPAFSPDGHYVATAANEWEARGRLWDLTSPNPCADPVLLDPHKPVDKREDTGYEVQFSPDSRWAATTSMDRVGRLWDLQSGAEPTLIAEVPFDNRVIPAAFSPDGRWVAFGSWDRTAKVLDLSQPDAKPVVLAGHAARILSLTFTPDARWLVTGSEDRSVRLWDPANPGTAPVILRGHEAGVFDIGFTDGGRRMVTGALDGTVRIWRLKLDDLIDVACRVAGRELTADEVAAYLGGPQNKLCGQ
jgi:WD40 repeat protein